MDGRLAMNGSFALLARCIKDASCVVVRTGSDTFGAREHWAIT
jgi:branched-chain amino acid transport system substrate-binding protein